MPTLRIEAKQDAATGLFFLAIHMPAESAEPYVTTAPRYALKQGALRLQVREMLQSRTRSTQRAPRQHQS